MSVRVRLAPSPTGEPHVGTMRTAIFDWLLVQHEGGQTVVRVEDTDQSRYAPETIGSLLDSLQWMDIVPDEGPTSGGPFAPYVQSERLPSYEEAASRLIERQRAYRCYCSPERLDIMRRTQQAVGQPPRYDRRCRWLSLEERAAREAAGEGAVVRFAVPLEGETRVTDLIRGEITFANDSQDDFVILKSDGFPTYHLAVVVDDHAMQITHVLRGDEWLPSFPKHVMLYEALGFAPPHFAHLPLILGADRKKLSKRHGDTAISAFRREGFLPQALFNFLGLLGWSLDDHTEIISRKQFCAHFSLTRVSKSPAIFDLDKLKWMNGVYIRGLEPEAFARLVAEWLDAGLPAEVPRPLALEYVAAIAPLIQERIKLLSEIRDLTDFFFLDGPLTYSRPQLLGKRFAAEAGAAADALRAVSEVTLSARDWTRAELQGLIEPLTEQLSLKRGELYGLIRVAITGKTVAPPLFESMEILGRTRTLERLESALRELGGGVGA